MLVIVVYDIADDRRRVHLSNLLEGYGRGVHTISQKERYL